MAEIGDTTIVDLLGQPDGSLDWFGRRSSAPFVSWPAGATHVVLDGDFTLDDLESIVGHMRKTLTPRTTVPT